MGLRAHKLFIYSIVVICLAVAAVFFLRAAQDATNNSYVANNLEDEARSRYSQQKAHLKMRIQEPSEVFSLTNEHFAAGSVVIDDNFIILADQNGQTTKVEKNTDNIVFRLKEDIVFNPNQITADRPAHQAGYVSPEQYQFYDPKAFGIGFFSSLVIQADNIIVDLNGFEISQSREHSLQQRFFSLIELASQPFVPEQGPADFGSQILSAKNVSIVNGSLGNSSHHAIHGQLPENILLEDLTMSEFEVAAVSLHGADDVSMVNVDIQGNKQDVEVLGLYSALRFIQPYVASLPDGYSMTVDGQDITKETLLAKLHEINSAVISDDNWQEAYPELANDSGLTDGNVYGVLINPKGVAVNGFSSTYDAVHASEDIFLDSVSISNLSVAVNEIPALDKGDPMMGPQNDVVGALFQLYPHTGPAGEFTGTINTAPIQLGQAMVAKAINEQVSFGRLPTDRNTITPSTVAWVEGETSIYETGNRLILNGDSMHHVNKGINALRIDGSNRVFLNDVSIQDISNKSEPCMSFASLVNYHQQLNEFELAYDNRETLGLKGATTNGAGGNDTRGLAISSSRNVNAKNLSITNLMSAHGPSFGVDVQYDSDMISIESTEVSNIAQNTNINTPGNIEPSKPIRDTTSQKVK